MRYGSGWLSIVGLALGAVVVGWAHTSMGGDLRIFAQPEALAVVFGGTAAALLVSFPGSALRSALAGVGDLLRRPAPLETLVPAFIGYARKARRQGLARERVRHHRGNVDLVLERQLALAQQTARATAEIGQPLTGLQATTQKAVAAIETITGTIRAINEASTTIAAAVEQQDAATREIVSAVTQASVGTAEVTQNITGVARMAEETGSGAGQVLSASSELAGQAENLRSQVHTFLSRVRAG